jgi:hypothetical protein
MSRRGAAGRSLAAAGCLLTTVLTAACTASRAADPPDGAVRVLQMNLCDSGIAGCYTGRSVGEAARVIRDQGPDVVTLNEVCRNDVATLGRALDNVRGGRTIVRFQAVPRAGDGRAPVRCRTGQDYGIGVLVHRPPRERGYSARAAGYPAQDPRDTEQRMWLCVRVVGAFTACTTHLASTSTAVAFEQCRYLMGTALPALTARDPGRPLILGGDLNLPATRFPNVRSCVPPGYLRTDDGGRQDVVAIGAVSLSGRSIDMHGTTDHPGLVTEVAFTRRESVAPPAGQGGLPHHRPGSGHS